MPLLKGKSDKKNVAADMDAGKQSLAIAFDIKKRSAKKTNKMSDGGLVGDNSPQDKEMPEFDHDDLYSDGGMIDGDNSDEHMHEVMPDDNVSEMESMDDAMEEKEESPAPRFRLKLRK